MSDALNRASVVAWIGDTIDGRYTVLSAVGEGGMGVVYKARDQEGHEVAIKVLHEELGDSQELRERFEREARALFALEHPNVLAVHDFGIAKGSPYLVMELLKGKALDTFIEETPPGPEEALELFNQLMTGLSFAHDKNIAHRDLKTENVWVQEENGRRTVKLLDFGLVKFTDDSRWGSSKKLTMQGSVFGSPAYMPPEQCTGQGADERSDVYAAGVILYELLTGCWPFMEETQVAMFQAHLTKTPPPINEMMEGDVSVHPDVEAIYQKAMAKMKAERFTNATDMLNAMRRVSQPLVRAGAAVAPAGRASISGDEMPTGKAGGPPKWVFAAAAAVVVVGAALALLL